MAATAAERLRIPDSRTPLRVLLPAATSRLVVGVEVDAPRVEVSLAPESVRKPLAVKARGEPGQGHYATFELPEPASELQIKLSRPGEIFFVGYDA